jgi:hypothetical protein
VVSITYLALARGEKVTKTALRAAFQKCIPNLDKLIDRLSTYVITHDALLLMENKMGLDRGRLAESFRASQYVLALLKEQYPDQMDEYEEEGEEEEEEEEEDDERVPGRAFHSFLVDRRHLTPFTRLHSSLSSNVAIILSMLSTSLTT